MVAAIDLRPGRRCASRWVFWGLASKKRVGGDGVIKRRFPTNARQELLPKAMRGVCGKEVCCSSNSRAPYSRMQLRGRRAAEGAFSESALTTNKHSPLWATRARIPPATTTCNMAAILGRRGREDSIASSLPLAEFLSQCVKAQQPALLYRAAHARVYQQKQASLTSRIRRSSSESRDSRVWDWRCRQRRGCGWCRHHRRCCASRPDPSSVTCELQDNSPSWWNLLPNTARLTQWRPLNMNRQGKMVAKEESHARLLCPHLDRDSRLCVATLYYAK